MSFGDRPRVVLGSITSPACYFECYDGSTTEMGGRRFQRWVGCNFDLIKFSGDFLSVYWFPLNSEMFVSIGTVLFGWSPWRDKVLQWGAHFWTTFGTSPWRDKVLWRGAHFWTTFGQSPWRDKVIRRRAYLFLDHIWLMPKMWFFSHTAWQELSNEELSPFNVSTTFFTLLFNWFLIR